MGGACSAESNMETGNIDQQKDLPAIDTKGKDPYEKFELGLPFCKILIKDFVAKVERAHVESGKEGFVTIETLSH
jgi:hypothetical protein